MSAADFKAYADCLKILLEVAPATSAHPPLLNLSAPGCVESRQRAEGLRQALQEQLGRVQDAMRGLCESSDSHRAYFSSPAARRGRENLESSPPTRDMSVRWGSFQGCKAAITPQLLGTHFQANIR